MIDTSAQRRFEALLPRVRRPARLIGGEVGASSGYSSDPHELRVVLAFPDTYEIGISNQAIQILYGLARATEGVGVERTYLPWVDVISEMRKERIPLLTLETWSPVASADLLGVTLQHESSYTNLLEMLNLAGLPFRSSERDADHPLVIVGGPACANFLPMAPLVDAVVVGDGEEVFPEILGVMKEAKKAEWERAQVKQGLSEIEGVFVPGRSTRVKRRCVSRLEAAPYPASSIVPLTEGVHDRAWVEVMRGCTRGCRFCQAGMWYRPVRERSVGQVLSMTKTQIEDTGYEEIAFASLSTTDYSGLEELLSETARTHPEVRVSLPSLRVDSAAVRLAALASPTGPSLTLAPEAGSQRMRDVINKNVSEDDILGAVEESVRAGKTTLKLYFMIGLPRETDEDAVAIGDLCLRIRESARKTMGSRANRLQLNVSISNFIPKPFTPFQWAGSADRETLVRRQALIRDRLRRRGIRVSFSRVETSYLEASLARGGDEMTTVIEEAWRRGARLDSWSEQYRGEAWDEAFASAGTSAEELATATLDPAEALPWDVIEGVVDKAFLLEEWEKAAEAETTPDCRWYECASCGACDTTLANDLAVARGRETEEEDNNRSLVGTEGMEAAEARAQVGPAADTERYRYAASFSVTGRGIFLGHLDRAEILRRAIRRAGGRLALSAGMRPKPLLSLALPLAVGVEGLEEIAGFELSTPADEGFADRLGEALPEHMRLLELRPYDNSRSLAARVCGASYEVQVEAGGQTDDAAAKLRQAVERFVEAESLCVDEEREGRRRRLDVREYVDSVTVSVDEQGSFNVGFRTKISPAGTVRPERVIEALESLSEVALDAVRITRTHIHLTEDEG